VQLLCSPGEVFGPCEDDEVLEQLEIEVVLQADRLAMRQPHGKHSNNALAATPSSAITPPPRLPNLSRWHSNQL
jgi:hypothetical protein